MLAVLLASYGTPNSPDEVEAYYTHILRGRKPPYDRLEDLKRRYIAIGGRSPLLEITQRQAEALEKKLAEDGVQVRTYVGMRHWHPFIDDVAREICRSGLRELIVIPLTPHYSSTSVGEYRETVQRALTQLGADITLKFVESWHLNPLLLKTWETLIGEALAEYATLNSVYLLFTAHSMPVRYIHQGDPYERQLLETSMELAKTLAMERWGLAYQSAGHTHEPWLGPDLLEKMNKLAKEGEKNVLVAPVGFVSDHLEVLYDIDLEAASLARQLGLRLRRTRMPNDAPTFVATLASVTKQML